MPKYAQNQGIGLGMKVPSGGKLWLLKPILELSEKLFSLKKHSNWSTESDFMAFFFDRFKSSYEINRLVDNVLKSALVNQFDHFLWLNNFSDNFS